MQIRTFLSEGNPVLWLPTSLVCQFQRWRIGACLQSLSRLSKLESPIKGTLASLLSYMMRSVDSNPIVTESHLAEALANLNHHGIAGHFGMFFLHDLNLDARPGESLLPEIQDDSQQLLADMKDTPCQRTTRRIFFPENGHNLNNYPLGRNPTWAAITRCLSTLPTILLKEWHPLASTQRQMQIGKIFVMFTQQFPCYLQKALLAESWSTVTTLDEAMACWTLKKIRDSIINANFRPCNAGLLGSRTGKEDMPFSERRHIFFPPPDFEHHANSKWLGFLTHGGYLECYHRLLQETSRGDNHESALDALDEHLRDIFHHLQCLPVSQLGTQSSPGQPWIQAGGHLQFIVNPKYFKIDGVGKSGGNNGERRQRLTVSRKQFEKMIGGSRVQHAAAKRRRDRVSAKTLGRRKPPFRKMKKDAANSMCKKAESGESSDSDRGSHMSSDKADSGEDSENRDWDEGVDEGSDDGDKGKRTYFLRSMVSVWLPILVINYC